MDEKLQQLMQSMVGHFEPNMANNQEYINGVYQYYASQGFTPKAMVTDMLQRYGRPAEKINDEFLSPRFEQFGLDSQYVNTPLRVTQFKPQQQQQAQQQPQQQQAAPAQPQPESTSTADLVSAISSSQQEAPVSQMRDIGQEAVRQHAQAYAEGDIKPKVLDTTRTMSDSDMRNEIIEYQKRKGLPESLTAIANELHGEELRQWYHNMQDNMAAEAEQNRRIQEQLREGRMPEIQDSPDEIRKNKLIDQLAEEYEDVTYLDSEGKPVEIGSFTDYLNVSRIGSAKVKGLDIGDFLVANGIPATNGREIVLLDRRFINKLNAQLPQIQQSQEDRNLLAALYNPFAGAFLQGITSRELESLRNRLDMDTDQYVTRMSYPEFVEHMYRVAAKNPSLSSVASDDDGSPLTFDEAMQNREGFLKIGRWYAKNMLGKEFLVAGDEWSARSQNMDANQYARDVAAQREGYQEQIEDYQAGGVETAVTAFGQAATSFVNKIPKAAGIISSTITGTPLSQSASYQLGDLVERRMNSLSVNPDMENTVAIASGAGSIVQSLLFGAGGAASSAFVSGLDMAVPEFENALRETGSVGKAWAAFLMNMGYGAMDVLPLMKYMKGAQKAVGPTALSKAATNYMRNISSDLSVAGMRDMRTAGLVGGFSQGIQEGGQEMLQGFLSNLTAQQLYDTTREVLNEDLLKEGSVGMLLGAIMGASGSMRQKYMNDRASQELIGEIESMTQDFAESIGIQPGDSFRDIINKRVAQSLEQELDRPPTEEEIQERAEEIIGDALPESRDGFPVVQDEDSPADQDQSAIEENQSLAEGIASDLQTQVGQQPAPEAQPMPQGEVQTETAQTQPEEQPGTVQPEPDATPQPLQEQPAPTTPEAAEAQDRVLTIGEKRAKTKEIRGQIDELVSMLVADGMTKKEAMAEVKEYGLDVPVGAVKLSQINEISRRIQEQMESLASIVPQAAEAQPQAEPAQPETQPTETAQTAPETAQIQPETPAPEPEQPAKKQTKNQILGLPKPAQATKQTSQQEQPEVVSQQQENQEQDQDEEDEPLSFREAYEPIAKARKIEGFDPDDSADGRVTLKSPPKTASEVSSAVDNMGKIANEDSPYISTDTVRSAADSVAESIAGPLLSLKSTKDLDDLEASVESAESMPIPEDSKKKLRDALESKAVEFAKSYVKSETDPDKLNEAADKVERIIGGYHDADRTDAVVALNEKADKIRRKKKEESSAKPKTKAKSEASEEASSEQVEEPKEDARFNELKALAEEYAEIKWRKFEEKHGYKFKDKIRNDKSLSYNQREELLKIAESKAKKSGGAGRLADINSAISKIRDEVKVRITNFDSANKGEKGYAKNRRKEAEKIATEAIAKLQGLTSDVHGAIGMQYLNMFAEQAGITGADFDSAEFVEKFADAILSKGQKTKGGIPSFEKLENSKSESAAKNVLAQRFSDEEPATKEYMASILAVIQHAFPNISIVMDSKEFTDALLRARYKGPRPHGFVLDGVIYLDPKTVKTDTPVHEAAHIYLGVLKSENPGLYSQMEQAAKGSDTYGKIREMYPDKPESEVLEEVIADAIGKAGSKIFSNEDLEPRPKDSKLVALAKKAINAIAKALNIREPFAMYTLEDLATQQAAAILSGKKVSEMTSEEFASMYRGMKEQRAAATKDYQTFKKDNPDLYKKAIKALSQEHADTIREYVIAKAVKNAIKGKNPEPDLMASYLDAIHSLDYVDARNRLVKAAINEGIPEDMASHVVDRNMTNLTRNAIKTVVGKFNDFYKDQIEGIQKKKQDELDAANEHFDKKLEEVKNSLSGGELKVAEKALRGARAQRRAEIRDKYDKSIASAKSKMGSAKSSFKNILGTLKESGGKVIDANMRAAWEEVIAEEIAAQTKDKNLDFKRSEIVGLARMIVNTNSKASFDRAMAFVDKVVNNAETRKLYSELDSKRTEIRKKVKKIAKSGGIERSILRYARMMAAVDPKGINQSSLGQYATYEDFLKDYNEMADKIIDGSFINNSTDSSRVEEVYKVSRNEDYAKQQKKRRDLAAKILADNAARDIVEREYLAANVGIGGMPSIDPTNPEWWAKDNLTDGVIEAVLEIHEQEVINRKALDKAARGKLWLDRMEERRERLTAEIDELYANLERILATYKSNAFDDTDEGHIVKEVIHAAQNPDEYSVEQLQILRNELYNYSNTGYFGKPAYDEFIVKKRIKERINEPFNDPIGTTGKTIVKRINELDRMSRAAIRGKKRRIPIPGKTGDLLSDAMNATISGTRRALYSGGNTKLQALLRSAPAWHIARAFGYVRGSLGNPFWKNVFFPMDLAARRFASERDEIMKEYQKMMLKHAKGLKYNESAAKIMIAAALKRKPVYDYDKHGTLDEYNEYIGKRRELFALRMQRSMSHEESFSKSLSLSRAERVSGMYNRILEEYEKKNPSHIKTDTEGRLDRQDGRPAKYIADIDIDSFLNADEKAMFEWMTDKLTSQILDRMRFTARTIHGKEFVEESNYLPLRAVKDNSNDMDEILNEILQGSTDHGFSYNTKSGSVEAINDKADNIRYDWDAFRVFEGHITNALFDIHMTPHAKVVLTAFNPKNKSGGLVGYSNTEGGETLNKTAAEQLHNFMIAKLKGVRGHRIEVSEAYKLFKNSFLRFMHNRVVSFKNSAQDVMDQVRVVFALGPKYYKKGIATSMAVARQGHAPWDIISFFRQQNPGAYSHLMKTTGGSKLEQTSFNMRNDGNAFDEIRHAIVHKMSQNAATRAVLVNAPDAMQRFHRATTEGMVNFMQNANQSIMFYGAIQKYYEQELGKKDVDFNDWRNLDPSAVAYASEQMQRTFAPDTEIGKSIAMNTIADVHGKTRSGADKITREVYRLMFYGFRNYIANQSRNFQVYMEDAMNARNADEAIANLTAGFGQLMSVAGWMVAEQIMSYMYAVVSGDEEEQKRTLANIDLNNQRFWQKIMMSALVEGFTGNMGLAYNMTGAAIETVNQLAHGEDYDPFEDNITMSPSLAPFVGIVPKAKLRNDSDYELERVKEQMTDEAFIRLVFGPTYFTGRRVYKELLPWELGSDLVDEEVTTAERMLAVLMLDRALGLNLIPFSGDADRILSSMKRLAQNQRREARKLAKKRKGRGENDMNFDAGFNMDMDMGF